MFKSNSNISVYRKLDFAFLHYPFLNLILLIDYQIVTTNYDWMLKLALVI